MVCHMLLRNPIGWRQNMSCVHWSWRLLVTLSRYFLSGGDRSQAEVGLGVNGRWDHRDTICTKQNLFERICWKGKQRNDSCMTDWWKENWVQGSRFLVWFVLNEKYYCICIYIRSNAAKERLMTDVGERRWPKEWCPWEDWRSGSSPQGPSILGLKIRLIQSKPETSAKFCGIDCVYSHSSEEPPGRLAHWWGFLGGEGSNT